MNLQEWRESRLRGNETFELPSGLEVTIKPVTMQELVVQGRVPDTLFAAIDDLTAKAQAGTLQRGLKANDLSMMSQLITIVCTASIVGPEGLTVEELPFGDRLEIFNRANAEAARLVTFPATGPANGVADASAGQNVRRSSKRVPRAKRG